VSAFWWLFGLAAYTLWATSLTPSLLKPLQDLVAGNPVLQALFNGQNMTTNTGFIGSVVFLIAPILSVAFALYLALAWPNDLDSGRLELVMSTPISRTRLQLERFLAVFIFALLAPLLTWGMILLGAQMVNISVDNGKIAAASLGLLPLELVMATFVYAVTIRLRSGLILGLSALYLALAFLGELIKGQLNLPEWLMSLSIFHVYGNPAVDGWRWGQWGSLLGVALAFLLIGIIQFRLANVDRGA
jgi:ABC-2 type transport system permease protein